MVWWSIVQKSKWTQTSVLVCREFRAIQCLHHGRNSSSLSSLRTPFEFGPTTAGLCFELSVSGLFCVLSFSFPCWHHFLWPALSFPPQPLLSLMPRRLLFITARLTVCAGSLRIRSRSPVHCLSWLHLCLTQHPLLELSPDDILSASLYAFKFPRILSVHHLLFTLPRGTFREHGGHAAIP